MSLYSDLVLSDLAAAVWLLDDPSSTTSGSSVVDLTGAGYNGQNHCNPGAGQSSIVSGGPTTWGGDGTNSIWVPSGGPLPHGGQPFSYEAWINPITGFGGSGYPAGFHMVTVWGGGAGIPNQTTFAWNEVTGSPGTFLLELVNVAGGVFHRVIAPTTDLRDSWHHVLVTWDGTTVTFYLDGTAVALDTSVAPDDIAAMGDAFTGVAAYVAGSDPSSGLNHWCGKIGAVAIYPTALIACQVQSHYDLMMTGTYTPCLHWVRLSHVSGHGYWQSKGDVTEEWADNRLQLRLPFPAVSSPPAVFLGIDGASGLPATTALPTPANHGLAPIVPPVPVVTTTSTCDPLRCGAASNMRDHLLSLYSAWARVLGPAVKFAEAFGVDAAISALAELALDSLVLGPFAAAVWAAIAPVMATILTLAIPDPVPSVTLDQSQVVWNGAYCQLTCSGDVVDPTSLEVQALNSYLTDHSGAFTSPSLQLALLNALLDFTPLLDWQTAAATAAPNSGCAGFTCP